MLYIFDFDYTLFDTAGFKSGFCGLLDQLVYDPENLKLDYFKKNKIHYNIKEHLGILGKNLKDRRQARITLENFLSDLRNYVFSGAKELLAKLQSGGHGLVLISLGNIGFQKAKVRGSGLEKFFEKMIFANDSKGSVLRKMTDREEEVIIVNDNARESLEMMKFFNNPKLFLVRGPYSQNDKNFKSHSLEEILNFE